MNVDEAIARCETDEIFEALMNQGKASPVRELGRTRSEAGEPMKREKCSVTPCIGRACRRNDELNLKIGRDVMESDRDAMPEMGYVHSEADDG